jgi:hypothetical protein
VSHQLIYENCYTRRKYANTFPKKPVICHAFYAIAFRERNLRQNIPRNLCLLLAMLAPQNTSDGRPQCKMSSHIAAASTYVTQLPEEFSYYIYHPKINLQSISIGGMHSFHKSCDHLNCSGRAALMLCMTPQAFLVLVYVWSQPPRE